MVWAKVLLVNYFTSEHISVIPQVAVTANQIDYWIFRCWCLDKYRDKLHIFAFYRQVHSLRHQTMILFSGIECQCPVGGKTSLSP